MFSGVVFCHCTGVAKSSRGTALSFCPTLSRRRRSLSAPAISAREFSVRLTCSSMFDCPEHSQTSPTSTSPTVCVAAPELAVSV